VGEIKKQSCNEIIFLNFFLIFNFFFGFTMDGMRWDMTSFGDFGNACLEIGSD